MSTIFSYITIANALAEISAGYAKLHENNGRGGLAIGLQKGEGPLGTQLKPNTLPASVSGVDGAYHAPGNCDSFTCSSQSIAASRAADALRSQQVPAGEHVAAFTNRANTEQGLTPAVWPYANPFEAAQPDQPYQPNRIPTSPIKNLNGYLLDSTFLKM